MGIFQRLGWSKPSEIKAAPAGITTSDPDLYSLFGGQPIASGVQVSPETAMKCVPVAAAVRRISQTIGTLPIHVYKRDARGGRERAPGHPLYKLVNGQVSSWRSAGELRELMTQDALLRGHGFAIVIRDGVDVPRGLEYVPAGSVQIDTDDATGEPLYRVSLKTGQRRTYRAYEMLHLRDPAGSTVSQGAEAIGLSLLLERQAATLFKNNARPGGIVVPGSDAGASALDGILAAWKLAFSGEGSGLPAVLPKDSTYINPALSPIDAQHIESRKFQLLEIARLFGLPPIMLQDYERAIKSNAEEMGRLFLNYCLSTWIRRWEDEIHLKLIADDEKDSYYAEFLVDELLRGDIKTRSEAISLQIASRTLSPNEARAMENRPPYEGGDAFENPHTTSAAAATLMQDRGQPADV
ncbi:phage portal protein [Bosea sp. RCC_152_1]|uniref:phage portal protein n=1 Tax=Bosea sp. RCC_152_1 TaxID=3239228 RepID=UPI00352411C8